MLTCFFDQEMIVHREFFPPGMTVNAEFYCDDLRRLRENVRRKRPQKWQNQNLIIHHDNAPAHRSFKVSQFLANNNMTVIPIPHTHPIWPPVNFSSSPSWSFGWRVEDSTPLKRFKRNRSGYLTQFQKGTSRDASKHGRNAGTAVFVQKGVLWRWWRNLTSKVSKLLFTSTVLELLDTSLYMADKKNTRRFTAAHPGVRRPLGRFRSIWETTTKVCRETPNLVKTGQKFWALHIKT